MILPTTPVRAVIFDKDGTLHDTERIYDEAWRMAARDLAVPDIETTLLACTGRNYADSQIYWEKKYPDIPFAPFMEVRDQYYNAMVAEGVPVKEGAYELLDYLKSRGYRIGMATSTGIKKVTDHLRRTDMLRYFDENAIMTGDRVSRGKPDPEIFLTAAERLGTAPRFCIGVEDSVNGIHAIHAAGMRPIMVPDVTLPTPEIESLCFHVCDTLRDLIPILESLPKN